MPDGSIKRVHVLGRALKQEAGKSSFVGAVMDITVMKNAFEEIQTLRDQLYFAKKSTSPECSKRS